MNKLWEFEPCNHLVDLGFHNVLEDFYKYKINGLVRENIQNSLDAKNDNSKSPVIVTISTGHVNKKDIPGIDEIEKRINALVGESGYTSETIENMKKSIKKDVVNYITFEDENTKGLNSENWQYYAYMKNAHYIEENKDKEKMRGGSHGIGKIASNAASDIHIMYFSNCDSDNIKKIGGNIQLIEHTYENQNYRSTGNFSLLDENNNFIAYENIYNGLFEKNTRGLKIIIPFLKEEYTNEKNIIRAVCDSFFMAILNENLIVKISNQIIDKDFIINLLCEQDLYESGDRYNFTLEYIDTYLNNNPIKICVPDNNKNYEFKLYIKYDQEKLPNGRVAVIRTVGMKIEDMRIRNHVRSPFNAVLIPCSTDEDEFLKSLENQSHTELSNSHIRNVLDSLNAKRFINNLNKEVALIISDFISKNEPESGIIDTDDLFYTVENEFKKSIKKNKKEIILNPEGESVQKVIIKKDINETEGKKGTPQNDNDPNKIRKRDKIGEKDGKNIYITKIKTNEIRRIVIDKIENLSIDLSNIDHFKDNNICNLHFYILDGEGKYSKDNLEISGFYKTIKNISNSLSCSNEENKILDIEISNGRVDLEMELNDNSNNNLKFAYSVEV